MPHRLPHVRRPCSSRPRRLHADGPAQPSYAFDGQPPVALGAPLAVPASWLDGVLAAGVIATTYGGPTFPAAWDSFEVLAAP